MKIAMKKLKFSPSLITPILKSEKYTTWRLWDDKNLHAGDKLELINSSSKETFATAIISDVKETTFGSLSSEDWEGHEKYSTPQEMYATHSVYYNKPVNSKTPLKIVHFILIK